MSVRFRAARRDGRSRVHSDLRVLTFAVGEIGKRLRMQGFVDELHDDRDREQSTSAPIVHDDQRAVVLRPRLRRLPDTVAEALRDPDDRLGIPRRGVQSVDLRLHYPNAYGEEKPKQEETHYPLGRAHRLAFLGQG
jgi:hypothetical protein